MSVVCDRVIQTVTLLEQPGQSQSLFSRFPWVRSLGRGQSAQGPTKGPSGCCLGPGSHLSLGALLQSLWVLAEPRFLQLWDKGPRFLEATCHSFPAIQRQASSRPVGLGLFRACGLHFETILENIFIRSNRFGLVWVYPTPTSRTRSSSCPATLSPLNTNFPSPSPWPLPSYCLSLWICLFWVPPISGIIPCVLLRVFLEHNVLKVSSMSSQVSEFASFYG